MNKHTAAAISAFRAQAGYRADIDGLRAIAVLSVLLYHAGADYVPGGFVGVDVFFVISGYLISRQIFTEISEKRFSIVRFYERRARRILPAFCFVSLLALVCAWFIFLPAEFVAFSKSLIASALFASNIHFWQASDYFAPAADTLPLLHYWSLGVEEQFYLFFPLLVLLFARFRSVFLLVTGGLIGSLILSYLAVFHWPVAAFYLSPFRAWELLIGSLIALRGFPATKSTVIATAASALGVGLVLYAATFYSDKMPFPGAAAIPPCLGAALILWGGQTRNPVAFILGLQPMRFIGAISYSLYLVHWPLIVFSEAADIELGTAWILLLSIAGATFSYYVIEQPVRTRRAYWDRRRVFGFFAPATVALLVCGAVVIQLNGLPQRLPSSVQFLLNYNFAYAKPYQEGRCFLRPEQTFEDYDINDCLPKKAPLVVLWGDSHAAHFYPGLSAAFADHGVALGQITASACPPIVGRPAPDRPNCKPFNTFALATILQRKPDLLVLSAYWPDDREAMELLGSTIDRLKKAGIEIAMLGQGPSYKKPVPNAVALRIMQGNHSTTADYSDSELDQSVYATDREMRELFGDRVAYISVLDTVCSDTGCPMMVGDEPVHWDTVHLTAAGSTLFAKKLAPKLLDILHAGTVPAVSEAAPSRSPNPG